MFKYVINIYSFDEKESESAIKYKLLLSVVSLGFILAGMGTFYRFSLAFAYGKSTDMEQAVFDAAVTLIFLILALLLFRFKSLYWIASRLFIFSGSFIAFSTIYFAAPTLVSFSVILLLLIVMMMFIKGKERWYWIAMFAVAVFGAFFVEQFKEQRAQLVGLYLVGIMMILIFNAHEKIINSSKREQIAVAEEMRNALLGKMVSMIAHQWRQPLSAITAITAKLLIKSKLNDADPASLQDYEKIEEITLKLSDSINMFCDVFKVENGREAVAIDEVAAEALHQFDATHFDLDVEHRLDFRSKAYVHIRKKDMIKAIHQIIENAYERFGTINEHPELVVSTSENSETVTLSIYNKGSSISPEIFPFLFDPYYTTKKENQGVGLGLFVAKALAKKNGAKMMASNADNGVVFSFVFPKA